MEKREKREIEKFLKTIPDSYAEKVRGYVSLEGVPFASMLLYMLYV